METRKISFDNRTKTFSVKMEREDDLKTADKVYGKTKSIIEQEYNEQGTKDLISLLNRQKEVLEKNIKIAKDELNSLPKTEMEIAEIEEFIKKINQAETYSKKKTLDDRLMNFEKDLDKLIKDLNEINETVKNYLSK